MSEASERPTEANEVSTETNGVQTESNGVQTEANEVDEFLNASAQFDFKIDATTNRFLNNLRFMSEPGHDYADHDTSLETSLNRSHSLDDGKSLSNTDSPSSNASTPRKLIRVPRNMVDGFVDSNPGQPSCDVFKRIIREMCMEGGWGAGGHACVVGGVLGALGGYECLPHDWVAMLPLSNRKYLNGKVNALLDLFGLP